MAELIIKVTNLEEDPNQMHVDISPPQKLADMMYLAESGVMCVAQLAMQSVDTNEEKTRIAQMFAENLVEKIKITLQQSLSEDEEPVKRKPVIEATGGKFYS